MALISLASVAGVEKRRRLGKGDWGQRVRDSLPFYLFPFLPLRLPFHCAPATQARFSPPDLTVCPAGDVQYAQPSLWAFSGRSILDSTVSCDVTERYTLKQEPSSPPGLIDVDGGRLLRL